MGETKKEAGLGSGLLDEVKEVFEGFTGIVNGDVFDPSFWKGPEVKAEPAKETQRDDGTEVIEEEHRVRRGKRGTFLPAPKGEPKPDPKPDPKPE